MAQSEGIFYPSFISRLSTYAEVLKPLPSFLLGFIGLGASIIAGRGNVSSRLCLVAVAILVASAGANGLTNYLDRKIDARMDRTRGRALPSRRIDPPEKALPVILTMIAAGLGLAWLLHPLAFAADLAGTLVAATWRKKVTCIYPQGVIASCAPLLMGWFAVKPDLSWELLLLCVLIAFWLPLHVWSVIISHREEYQRAGHTYFPICAEFKSAARVLLVFSVCLYAASLALYFAGGFHGLYLAAASTLGLIMIYAALRLVVSKSPQDFWRLYKLSSFPYLGLIFLAMCLDLWL